MFAIIVFVIAIVLIALLLPYLIWRWMFGASLRKLLVQFFNIAHERDTIVDPEAPIEPSIRQPISDLIRQQAEQIKPVPLANESKVPQASIAATTSDKKTNYEPPYRENPVTIDTRAETVSELINNGIVKPARPLVEDDTFDVDDPIIDNQYIDPDTPSADTLDAHIPESDHFRYGVHSADHSPNRMIRDKRYRRNASDS